MRYTISAYDEAAEEYTDVTFTDSSFRAAIRAQQVALDRQQQTLVTDEQGGIILWCSREGRLTDDEGDAAHLGTPQR